MKGAHPKGTKPTTPKWRSSTSYPTISSRSGTTPLRLRAKCELVLAWAIGLERLRILDDVSLLLRRETESTNRVVVRHDVRERR
jgi:hypothetical protein